MRGHHHPSLVNARLHCTTTMDDTHARHQDDLTRYVLGEMSLDEQLAFDVRMTEDKQLARTVAAAMAIDDLLFRAAGPQGGDPSLGLD